MNKALLFDHVLTTLGAICQEAIDAANRAHATATNTESVAENKYDTFALEASYLADGQSQRVAQCQADIARFKQLTAPAIQHKVVAIGSLVEVVDQQDLSHYFLISPCAGGLKVQFNQKEIVCVTPLAPAGRALLGKEVGDEIEVNIAMQQQSFEITRLD